jgi:uncharacterized protein YjbI with pentapeptide repeats
MKYRSFLLVAATVVALILIEVTGSRLPSLTATRSALPLSLLLLCAGGLFAEVARKGLKESFRREFWREMSTGFIVGSVVSFAFGAISNQADEDRQARALRAENLAYVRSSLADPTGSRVYDGLDLRQQPLRGLDFRAGDPDGTTGPISFRLADLSGADLRSSDLTEADLRGSRLVEADLQGANLSGASFDEAKPCAFMEWKSQSTTLRGAKLMSANLTDARFERADLRGSNLNGADLTGAIISSADLRDTSLAYANLTDVILIDVDLRGADLSNAVLDNIRYARVVWPRNFQPPPQSGGGLSGGGGSCW